MHEQLLRATELAEAVRYSGDLRRAVDRIGTLQSSDIHYQFNESGLRITDEVTPGLSKVLANVCERLNIRRDAILAFVYASPEIQAGCYSADTSDCLITMTSGLVKLMADDELAFVVGHELGHFLLGHGVAHSSHLESTETLLGRRAMEISADRVGMLASPLGDAAFRSLIKTASGLEDSFLRYDVKTFLDQISGPGFSVMSESTHPSIIHRCRALLWFQMSAVFRSHVGDRSGESIDKVNARVEKDMQAFVDGPAKRRISDAAESMKLWLATVAAIRGGSFTKQGQTRISEEFGSEYLEKLVRLFDGCDRAEVEQIVRVKLLDSIRYFELIAPQSFRTEFEIYRATVGTRFDQSDFVTFLESFLSEASVNLGSL